LHHLNQPHFSGLLSCQRNPARHPAVCVHSQTDGEAQSRIEAKGFTNVTDLQKYDNGVLQGKAMKNGQQVNVSLDYQGNVIAK
jgi:hypothetical protein